MVALTEVFFEWSPYGQATLYLGNKIILRDETMHVIEYSTSLNYVEGRHL